MNSEQTFSHAPRKLRAAMLGATALGATLAASPAWAQPSGEASVDTNTIIVTAQRRSEALEDVPMTVSVISQETLATAGVNTFRDLANVSSGFQVGQGGSYPQPAIRGITTINAGSYENNVAVFVDGVYQTTPQILNIDLPNVQNIQILKGPQGTLYGRNATGGAILIDTIDPGDRWNGNLEASYGRFDDKRARAYVAGPIADSLGVSLAGTFRQTDGYYKIASRSTPGQFSGRGLGLKQESFRAKLKFDPSNDFHITLAYSYVHANDPRGVVFTPIENVSNNYIAAGRNTRPRGLGEVAGDAFAVDFKQHEASAKLEWDTGIGTLRSVTAFTRGQNRSLFDFNGVYVPDLYSDGIPVDRTWQESVDYSITAVDNLDLVIGGNYYNIKTAYDPASPNSLFLGPASYAPFNPPDPATTVVPLSEYRRSSDTYFFRKKEAWAIFADATFHVTDRLSINVGGRYSEEKQHVSGYKINYCTATVGCSVAGRGTIPLGGTISVPYSINGEAVNGFAPGFGASAKTSSYSKFTPRASIRYEVAPGTNVYASYSQGFRGGEWNSVIPSDNPALWLDVKQETIDAWEIGVKSGGHRLRFNLAAFYYDYKNLQVSYTAQLGNPPVALVVLQNSPGAKIYGAEANVDFSVDDNFNLHAGATWLHSRYKDGFIFSGVGVNPNAAAFNTNSDPLKALINKSLDQDLSGLQTSRAPDFSGFIGFDYRIPQGDGGIVLAANAKYTSSYVVTNPSIWGGWVASPGTPVDPLYSAAKIGQNDALLAGTPYAGRASQQRARQGAYVMVNASVTWTDPSDHYYVRVWGNNLTDQKYRIHYNPLASGTYEPIGEPLTFGGTIGYKF